MSSLDNLLKGKAKQNTKQTGLLEIEICFSHWVAFREKISRVVSSHSEENVRKI